MSINSKMTAIADEIRTLSGTIGAMGLDDMASNLVEANRDVSTETDLIAQIANVLDGKASSNNGSDTILPVLQDKTVTPTTSSQTVTPDNGYDGLSKVTVNAMPTATQATPDISIDSSTGIITASVIQDAGYVDAGSKSATKQLTTQSAQTITPGTSDKTIASGKYLTGNQTIKGDANLIPANIISGKSIFGVVGTATSGGSSGGSTQTATMTISIDAPIGASTENIYYVSPSGLEVICLTELPFGDTFIDCIVPSIIFSSGAFMSFSGGISELYRISSTRLYYITGPGTLYYG